MGIAKINKLLLPVRVKVFYEIKQKAYLHPQYFNHTRELYTQHNFDLFDNDGSVNLFLNVFLSIHLKRWTGDAGRVYSRAY